MNLIEYPSKCSIVCRNSEDLRDDLLPAATRSTSIEVVESTSRALEALQDASAEMSRYYAGFRSLTPILEVRIGKPVT